MGNRAALVAALLAVASPWHLLWSQMARYYTLVFLFGVVAVVGRWPAVERRRGRWLVARALSALLGVLAHPTVLLPLA